MEDGLRLDFCTMEWRVGGEGRGRKGTERFVCRPSVQNLAGRTACRGQWTSRGGMRGGIQRPQHHLQYSTRVYHLNYRLHLWSPNLISTSNPSPRPCPDLSHLPHPSFPCLQLTFHQHLHPLDRHRQTIPTLHLNDEHHRGQGPGRRPLNSSSNPNPHRTTPK